MSNLGLGVMLGILGGNSETVEAVQSALGKTITGMEVVDDNLRISLDDGTTLVLYDGGQSCCEYRHMSTDDDLSYHIGATLNNIELREAAPLSESEWGDVHEVQFLDVTTSKGVAQFANHNEHNGYYGGFWIVARTEQAPEKREDA